MSFIRTVLGDIDPAALGMTDSHEHVIIAGGKPVEISPDFLLADVDKAVTELEGAKASARRRHLQDGLVQDPQRLVGLPADQAVSAAGCDLREVAVLGVSQPARRNRGPD